MKRKNWEVKDHGIRPAGSPTECFYCNAQREAQHNEGCVIRERTVVVDVTIRMVITKPEDWDAEMIESHWNDSSWCQNNIMSYLEEQSENMGCLCGTLTTKFVREATEEDEQKYKLFVEELES